MSDTAAGPAVTASIVGWAKHYTASGSLVALANKKVVFMDLTKVVGTSRTDGVGKIVADSLILVGIVVVLFVTNWQMALLAYLVLPVMVVFLLLQRYYIQGVMAGSVKG